MHLAGIWIDGLLRRACDRCRSKAALVWACQSCGRDQGGHRHTRGGLVLCLECAARLDKTLADGP